MKDRLTLELVKADIEETESAFKRAWELYNNGLLRECDRFEKMSQAFWQGLWGFLREYGLEIRISEDNYPMLAEDRRAYQNGMELSSAEADPWLRSVSSGQGKVSAEDKKLVLCLIESFGLPSEYFAPMPKSIPGPCIKHIHLFRYAETVSIPFNCADDGGLLSDPEPVGKTFRLVNDIGLSAELTIKEDRRDADRNGMDFDELVVDTDRGIAALMAEFLAEGSIEGYTAKQRTGKKDVLIRLIKGKIDRLSYYSEPEDAEACRAFPRWSEYYRWIEQHERDRQRMLSELFEKYKQQ